MPDAISSPYALHQTSQACALARTLFTAPAVDNHQEQLLAWLTLTTFMVAAVVALTLL
jgi:hypothetical protein